MDIFWESHNWLHQLLVHAPYKFYQYMYLLYVNRFFNLHHIPFFVCIVAPVTNSTDSGDPFSSTSNFCNNKANATVDSISANWSPTHFLGPPPKGRNAKSAIIWWATIKSILRKWDHETMYASKNMETIKWPHLGIMRQGFEMDQTQPILQCLHSFFALKTSLAQTH